MLSRALAQLSRGGPGGRKLPLTFGRSELMGKDGPLAVEKLYRPLIAASLAASRVQNDSDGNSRMVKKGTNNTARDDVAAALALAAGAWKRTSWTPVSKGMAFA